jgi:undecaprenyl-diphosphatase
VWPYPERGRLPSLTLVHATDESGSRYVLRIWRSDRRLNDSSRSELWLGSVVEEQLSNRLFVASFPVAKDDVDGPRKVLLGALAQARLVSRVGRAADIKWDGTVLLVHEASSPTR